MVVLENLNLSENMQQIMETIDSDAWFGENILYVVMKEGSIVDLEAARSHLKKWQKYLNEHKEIKSYALVINMKGLITVTREARILYAKGGDVRSKAVALILGSPVTRIIANFIMYFSKPGKPIQVFNSQEAAFDWARKYL